MKRLLVRFISSITEIIYISSLFLCSLLFIATSSLYAQSVLSGSKADEKMKYYHHSGAFYPETMYFWGTYNGENYGRNRKGKPDGLTDNQYIRRYWQSGLEMSMMMLDYYAFTENKHFV